MSIYKFIRTVCEGLVVEVPETELTGVVIDYTIGDDYVKFTAVTEDRGIAVCVYHNEKWETHCYFVKGIAQAIK